MKWRANTCSIQDDPKSIECPQAALPFHPLFLLVDYRKKNSCLQEKEKNGKLLVKTGEDSRKLDKEDKE